MYADLLMINVLLVSIAFPPKNDPECLQTAKYFKYLKMDDNISISVVTSSNPTLFMPYEAKLEKYNDGFVQKVALPILETKLTNFILRKILPFGIDYPDSKFTFHHQKQFVVRKLKQLPDIIYSRSNPLSSTLLAYKLKKYYQVPWVMHLSDPWTDSPLHHYTKRQHEFHSKWEKKCVEAADVITLTSAHTVEFYKEKYSFHSDKFLLYPNVFDAVDVSNALPTLENKLKIVYTGGLSGSRSPATFLRACMELHKENNAFEQACDIVFAGPLDSSCKSIFKEYPLSNVCHIGQLPYEDSLALIKNSHMLLTIDAPVLDPKMAMFFPSKLLDYFLARRKIMALTKKGSATAKALQGINSYVLDFNDVEFIKFALKESIEAFASGDAGFFYVENIPLDYNAESNAKRLAQLFISVEKKDNNHHRHQA